MRSLVLAATAAATISVLVAAPADAKPHKPIADLVTKQVTATFSAGRITASASITNKGSKKAPTSVATFYLSADTKQSSDDRVLGTGPVRKLKAKKSTAVTGNFAVPANTPQGSYHVVICADSGAAVRERRETNNCSGSAATVLVVAQTVAPPAPPPPPRKVTISWSVAPLAIEGSVTGVATNGTCTSDPLSLTGEGSCVVDAGVGTVTLTASTLLPVFAFDSWTGTTCVGTKVRNTITFAPPGADATCTANFKPTLPI